MLTEYDVRREMNEIERSPMHPLRKVRRLLLIARKLRRAARKIGTGVAQLTRDCMYDEAERMRKAMERLVDLNREVKHRARLIWSRAQETGSGLDPSGPSTFRPSRT